MVWFGFVAQDANHNYLFIFLVMWVTQKGVFFSKTEQRGRDQQTVNIKTSELPTYR